MPDSETLTWALAMPLTLPVTASRSLVTTRGEPEPTRLIASVAGVPAFLREGEVALDLERAGHGGADARIDRAAGRGERIGARAGLDLDDADAAEAVVDRPVGVGRRVEVELAVVGQADRPETLCAGDGNVEVARGYAQPAGEVVGGVAQVEIAAGRARAAGRVVELARRGVLGDLAADLHSPVSKLAVEVMKAVSAWRLNCPA